MKKVDGIEERISIVKHDLANILAILQGKTDKLVRTNPTLGDDESIKSIQKNLNRLDVTIKKVGQLRPGASTTTKGS